MELYDIININPTCVITEVSKTNSKCSIFGFIDLDGSCGMNGKIKFSMKDKAFHIVFDSKGKFELIHHTITFKELYSMVYRDLMK